LVCGSNRQDQHKLKKSRKKGGPVSSASLSSSKLPENHQPSQVKTILVHLPIAIATGFGIIVPGRASSPVGRAAFKAVELLSKWLVGFDSCLFRHIL
jgi:hypothetical protein